MLIINNFNLINRKHYKNVGGTFMCSQFVCKFVSTFALDVCSACIKFYWFFCNYMHTYILVISIFYDKLSIFFLINISLQICDNILLR